MREGQFLLFYEHIGSAIRDARPDFDGKLKDLMTLFSFPVPVDHTTT